MNRWQEIKMVLNRCRAKIVRLLSTRLWSSARRSLEKEKNEIITVRIVHISVLLVLYHDPKWLNYYGMCLYVYGMYVSGM